MKLIKSEINYMIQVFATFTFINITANMFGLWFSKLLNEVEFTYLDSIANEFVKPLAIQSVLFGACFILAYIFLKNRKLSNYSFVIFQFVIFHIIFILNLKIHHGLHFQSTFNNLGLQYLSNNGQYLIDVLYLYFPINGNFENGLFMPDNLGTFYIHWILLNLLYYFALIWISLKVSKLFFEEKILK